MQFSLSKLVDNLSEVYDKECKKCRERKKIKVNCEFVRFENGKLHKILNGKNFPTLNKFCNDDLDNFFLLLRKYIYPYEYMDSWETFKEKYNTTQRIFL